MDRPAGYLKRVMPNSPMTITSGSYRALLRRAVVAAVASTAVVPAESYAQTGRYVGCYDVHLGDWSPGPLPSDSVHYLPPTRIRLSEEPGRGLGERPRGYMLDTAPDAMPSIHKYSWWQSTGDSIVLTWSTGFAGISIRVAGEDTLQGTGQRFVDVVPATQFSVTVRLTPINCEAPVPEERRKSHRFSPVVSFAGGLSLVLDSVPAPGLETERVSDNSLLVHADPLAPYDKADRVEMWLRPDGTVRVIRLQYPADVPWTAVVSALRDQFGAPTSEHPRPRLTMWASRLMVISVSESNSHVLVRLYSQPL